MQQVIKTDILNILESFFNSEDRSAFQKEAYSQFLEQGIPDKKNEEYKYTPLKRIFEKNFDSFSEYHGKVSSPEVKNLFIKEEGHHLVFVNGKFNRSLSKIADDSLVIEDLNETEKLNQIAKPKTDALAALNTAFFESGVDIRISKNKQAKPVFIYQVIDNRSQVVFSNPRLLITAETGSESKFVEKTYTLGQEKALINKLYEIDLQNNASVNFTKIQDYKPEIFEIDGLNARQTKDSRFYANTFSFGGGLIRNNLNIDLIEEHCETHMHGLYLLTGRSHVDNHTAVDHIKANSFSNEVYKGIVDDRAQGIFNGKIFVRPGAQQTNAFQANNNISLAETATIHTKPQLEIWADDVKCSHGCTIGQIDEEAIYYLRTRGISEKKARAMLLVAFAEASFEYIPFEFIKEELHRIIEDRLS